MTPKENNDDQEKDIQAAKDRLSITTDEAAVMTLQQLQKIVSDLVLLKDTERLLNLLSCTREIFRQADQAMAEGRNIDIIRS